MVQSVVIITGCSTGIGLSAAVLLAKNADKKYKVYATMRNLAKKDELLQKAAGCVDDTLFLLEVDVQSESSVTAAIKLVLDKDGRVDVLINNAGVGLCGALEYQQWDDIKTLYETNVFGVIHAVRAVLPSMKKRESGRIITVSSVAGLRGIPLHNVYCSTKFAVTGLMESLAPELEMFNIKVSLIEPGPVSTPFRNVARSKGIAGLEKGDEKTKQFVSNFVQLMDTTGRVVQSAEEIAEYIHKAVEDEKPHFHYITHEHYEDLVRKKYVDTTGDTMIHHAMERFFSSKAH